MIKFINKQFPSLKNPLTLVYLGTSMYPTLEELDIVQFQPYLGDAPRKGDIIVIQRNHEPKETIIHRIVTIDQTGIRTQGDNCNKMDPWILQPSDILGYVISTKRGNQVIHIVRGRLNYQKILSRKAARSLYSIAEFTHRKFVFIGLPTRLLSRFLKYRIVTFSGTNRSESRLFFGPLCIGRLQNGSAGWEIKAPYRLLIDPDLLRFMEAEQEEK